MKQDPKIGVVGCGALGSYYGAKLARAGRQIHFLLRSDYDVVRRQGVRIQSPEGDFRVQPKCARSPQDIGVCDLVLIGLKSTANDVFPELLPPLINDATTILTLQNGLGNEDTLARLFPAGQIMGGLCFVCLNRLEPGLIRHMDHGRIVLGEFTGWPEPRTHDVASLLRHAGIPCKVTDNLARAHWEKLVWNIPFNGLGVASAAGMDALREGRVHPDQSLQPCLSTDQLLKDPAWERYVRELMREIIQAAQALGFKVDPALEERMIENTRTMGAYKASTVLDFERGHQLELQTLFQEPLRQARQAGVSVPRLEALTRVLEHLDP